MRDDPRTRIIFDRRGVAFPPVPAAPTHAHATRALADLLDPFAEFPFVADTDRAAVAALILSVIGRAAIDGPVPMFRLALPDAGQREGAAGRCRSDDRDGPQGAAHAADGR